VAPRLEDRVLALAGVFQAGGLVQELATGQKPDPGAVDTLFHALLQTRPEDVPSVFGGVRPLRLGLGLVSWGLGAGSTAPETRYALAVLRLERHLTAREDLLQTIGRRIERLRLDPAAAAAQIPGADRDAARLRLAHDFAAIYTETLSTLPFRIQVQGRAEALRDTGVAARVRALLLAGVRCAVLWRQTGGRRRHLILSRNALRRTASALLHRAESDAPADAPQADRREDRP
jgi:high frequency lysogenization protein